MGTGLPRWLTRVILGLIAAVAIVIIWVVVSIRTDHPIDYADITPEMARASGFKGVVDLLKVAKHGRGENVYLVRFHYVPPGRRARPRAKLRAP